IGARVGSRAGVERCRRGCSWSGRGTGTSRADRGRDRGPDGCARGHRCARRRAGRRAVGADFAVGTLISPGLIVERLEVAGDQALVGLALPPGGWPSASLRAGDTVMVVQTGDTSGVL